MRRTLILILAMTSVAGCAAPPEPTTTRTQAAGPTPAPSPIAARLIVHGSGRLQGLSPMGVGAALVIQSDPSTRSADPVWELGQGEKIVFESTYDASSRDYIVGAPHDPPATIAPDRYRVGGVREIFSDVSSQPVAGERERVVILCEDTLVVEPSTTSVTIDIAFPGGDRCDLDIAIA